MPTLDFDAARRESGRRDPLRFKLGGQTFTCVPKVPFAWLMDVVAADMVPSSADQRFERSRAFLADVLATDADRKRLDGVLRSFEDPIDERDVYAAVRGLVEVYVVRPTSPPNGSSDGRRKNGASSNSSRTGRSPAKKRGS